jgi:hypothetical protein
MYEGVSADPRPFTVSPLTAEQVQRIFGSAHPGPDHVTQWAESGQFTDVRESWHGVYVISYAEDQQPLYLHFAGFSGD